jgi:hypothetical protein
LDIVVADKFAFEAADHLDPFQLWGLQSRKSKIGKRVRQILAVVERRELRGEKE